jgi:uridine kinase
MDYTNKPLIIGIAGGTGAGKTTFAKSIYRAFGGNEWGNNVDATTATECHITHLSHDDYYKDLTHLTMDERACVNFDHPSSLDTDLLITHLTQLLQGHSVIVPRYDYTRHCRFQEGEVDGEGRRTGRLVKSKRVILVEGILILSVQELVDLMDLKVFVDAPSDIRLSRRIQRDTVERGRTLPDILSQYSKTVRPMHNQFVEPSKLNADLIVYGHHENNEVSKKRMELAMKVICNHLKMETDLYE